MKAKRAEGILKRRIAFLEQKLDAWDYSRSKPRMILDELDATEIALECLEIYGEQYDELPFEGDEKLEKLEGAKNG